MVIRSQVEVWEDEMMHTITVREVMMLYHIKDPKTVINACISGRLKSRKADADYGARGGVWLIDHKAAEKIWGHRLKEKHHE